MAKKIIETNRLTGTLMPVTITETQATFNKLMTEMAGTLAPRLLVLMQDFGYTSFEITSDGHRETIVSKDLESMTESDAKFFKRRYMGYTSAEKNVFKHNDLLALFRKLKNGTEHLMKLRNQAEKGIEWIEKIGTIGKRQVLIEKFNPKSKK